MVLRILPVVALAACGQSTPFPTERPENACDAGALPQQELVLRMKFGGRTRAALIYPPAGPGPYDVVVNLHEFRADPRRQAHYSGWVPFGASENVLVVAPDGKSSTWNAGDCCGKARDQQVDDVAFLDALMTQIDASACTSGRVLATGIGNGAMMAHRWACESDVPDAVVTVGGSLQADACPNPRPIPALHYHGTADTFFPSDGSGGHRPVAHAEAAWTQRNQASSPTAVHQGDLECRQYAGSTPTQFCDIRGGKDTWPGSANGAVTSDSPLADATRGAWAWVRAAWDAPVTPAATSESPGNAPGDSAESTTPASTLPTHTP